MFISSGPAKTLLEIFVQSNNALVSKFGSTYIPQEAANLQNRLVELWTSEKNQAVFARIVKITQSIPDEEAYRHGLANHELKFKMDLLRYFYERWREHSMYADFVKLFELSTDLLEKVLMVTGEATACLDLQRSYLALSRDKPKTRYGKL